MNGAALAEPLTGRVLELADAMRTFGAGPVTQQAGDALQATLQVDIADREDVRLALRASLASSPAEQRIFDRLFPIFAAGLPFRKEHSSGKGSEPRPRPAPQEAPKPASGVRQVLAPKDDPDSAAGAPKQGPRRLSASAAPGPGGESVAVPLQDLNEMLEVAQALVQRLRKGRSRRFRPMASGSRLHFRRMLREAAISGGDLMLPRFLGRPMRHPRFTMLLDGSRSMASDTNRLLQFAYALTLRAERVDVFVFSTTLVRVTHLLRRGLDGSLPTLKDLGSAYGGGTRIGASLRTLLRDYGGTVSADTLVIIASDGLETGDVNVLEGAMKEIWMRSLGVVWLNPLLSTPGYEPTARGMAAALPHVDTFWDAGALAALPAQVRLRHSAIQLAG